ncbi:MAG: hypothetical protein ACOCVB_01650 [Bacillota bacterium]
MLKKLSGVILLLLIIFAISFTVKAIQVQPLVVNLDLKPGDTEEFQLTLVGGLKRETVNLTLMHPRQNISGRLSYQEIASDINPALDWLDLESEIVTVPANENIVVSGRVNIPFNAGGSHTAVIMVEEEEIDEGPGSIVGIKMRYAVRVNINIDRPGQRPSVDILDFSLEADEEGRPIISTHFKNTSLLRFPAVADVTIRGEDRRLLERVPVYSEATNIDRRDNFSVYPGSELIYKGQVTEPLFPGNYELQMFFRYADGRQIIRRQTVEIEDEFIQEDSLRYLTVEPLDISLSMIPGASSTQILTFNSHISEPLLVRTDQTSLGSEYPQSVFANLEFVLRGDSQFMLPPRGKSRQLLTFKSEREIKPGGYYGYHDIEVYNTEGQLLETHRVNLSSILKGEAETSGEIRDLSHDRGESVDTFSATVRNTGHIHIIPDVVLRLFDEEGDIYMNLNLSLQDEDKILPLQTRFVSGERRLVEAGEYTAEVILRAENEELDREEFMLTIVDNE